MKKRIVSLFLAITIIFSNIIVEASGFTYDNQVDTYLVGDVETGKIFFRKNDDKPYAVASMSKLMTYLVVMDSLKSGKIKLTDKVKADKEVASYTVGGYSNMGIFEGEILTAEDLIKGLMIVSGNDAAVMLAKHIAKTEQEFVKLMNIKAREIGLKHSTFVNASGITSYKKEGNNKVPIYNAMSSRDLFNLGIYIIKQYPETVEYGKQKILSMPSRNYVGESTFPTLRNDKGVMGLKTGYTEEAGYGFTGLFDMNKIEDGQKFRIITVVNSSPSKEGRSVTTDELVEYVRANHKYGIIVNSALPVVDKKDNSTVNKYVRLYPERDISRSIDQNDNYIINYTIDHTKTAPYENGEVMGTLTVSLNGEELEKINLISKGYVPKANIFKRLKNRIQDFFNKILLLF